MLQDSLLLFECFFELGTLFGQPPQLGGEASLAALQTALLLPQGIVLLAQQVIASVKRLFALQLCFSLGGDLLVRFGLSLDGGFLGLDKQFRSLGFTLLASRLDDPFGLGLALGMPSLFDPLVRKPAGCRAHQERD